MTDFKRRTVMQVERDDDLDMAWLWIARGWKGVDLMIGLSGHYCWLVRK